MIPQSQTNADRRNMLPAVVFACLLVAACTSPVPTDLDEEWSLFKKQYYKVYKEEEEFFRRFVWEDNLKYVQSHNLQADLGEHTYWLGMNEYADMPTEEFVSVMNGYHMNLSLPANELYEPASNVEDLAPVVDWVTKGLVTGVKNQGGCGSCWAFSATGSLEGQNAKKTKHLVPLSEQNLVDCSGPEGNKGCKGGQMDAAFRYVQKNHGIDTEASYPYQGKQGTCHFNRKTVGGTDSSYRDVSRGSESALQSAVASVGPVSVAIDASHKSFQLYRSGIYQDPSCSTTRLDHGVLVVGYGSNYWLVKNSWGTSWGNRGYIEMAKNKGNMCGIASSASYPVV